MKKTFFLILIILGTLLTPLIPRQYNNVIFFVEGVGNPDQYGNQILNVTIEQDIGGSWVTRGVITSQNYSITNTIVGIYNQSVRFTTVSAVNYTWIDDPTLMSDRTSVLISIGDLYEDEEMSLTEYELVTEEQGWVVTHSYTWEENVTIGAYDIRFEFYATGTSALYNLSFSDKGFLENIGWTAPDFDQTVEPEEDQSFSNTLGYGANWNSGTDSWGAYLASTSTQTDYVRVEDNEALNDFFQWRIYPSSFDIGTNKIAFLEFNITGWSGPSRVRLHVRYNGGTTQATYDIYGTGTYRWNIYEATSGASDIDRIMFQAYDTTSGDYVDFDYFIIYKFENYRYEASGGGSDCIAWKNQTNGYLEMRGEPSSYWRLAANSPPSLSTSTYAFMSAKIQGDMTSGGAKVDYSGTSSRLQGITTDLQTRYCALKSGYTTSYFVYIIYSGSTWLRAGQAKIYGYKDWEFNLIDNQDSYSYKQNKGILIGFNSEQELRLEQSISVNVYATSTLYITSKSFESNDSIVIRLDMSESGTIYPINETLGPNSWSHLEFSLSNYTGEVINTLYIYCEGHGGNSGIYLRDLYIESHSLDYGQNLQKGGEMDNQFEGAWEPYEWGYEGYFYNKPDYDLGGAIWNATGFYPLNNLQAFTVVTWLWVYAFNASEDLGEYLNGEVNEYYIMTQYVDSTHQISLLYNASHFFIARLSNGTDMIEAVNGPYEANKNFGENTKAFCIAFNWEQNGYLWLNVNDNATKSTNTMLGVVNASDDLTFLSRRDDLRYSSFVAILELSMYYYNITSHQYDLVYENGPDYQLERVYHSYSFNEYLLGYGASSTTLHDGVYTSGLRECWHFSLSITDLSGYLFPWPVLYPSEWIYLISVVALIVAPTPLLAYLKKEFSWDRIEDWVLKAMLALWVILMLLLIFLSGGV